MARQSLNRMTVSCWDRLSLLSSTSESRSIPVFLYGTAWKKEKTADLVYKALSSGFTGVDTAAQPKHYREDLVGEGIRRALSDGKVKRENLYIQTKYTSMTGQDPASTPYDPAMPIEEQIHSSIKSSLKNLRHSDNENPYLDTLVLHSPLPTIAETIQAWRTCEQYVPSKIRNLGISNCTLPVLSKLFHEARVKPAVVQNRFYLSTHYDVPLRDFCRENSIIYQSFWTLTANPDLVWSTEVGTLAARAGISPQAALYCLVLSLGNTVVLNGTTNEQHMVADLGAPKAVEQFVSSHPDVWMSILKGFKSRIGE